MGLILHSMEVRWHSGRTPACLAEGGGFESGWCQSDHQVETPRIVDALIVIFFLCVFCLFAIEGQLTPNCSSVNSRRLDSLENQSAFLVTFQVNIITTSRSPVQPTPLTTAVPNRFCTKD